ncbi:unnamed protein product [Caenorhabditis sp. 36 PRJEB53466]|nr:unnamed protein product [Caenorhabditis sp. 36 PRJEB53466]
MDTSTSASAPPVQEASRNGAKARSHSPEIDVDNIKSDCSSPVKLEKQDEVGEHPPVTRAILEMLQTTSSPTSRYRTTSSTSEGTENLIATLSAWDWVTIDGLKLPAVTRNKERYVAVHMVQLKLLSKFPPDIPREISQKFTMGSHKMTLAEAWTFNSINAIIRKFDLGCQLFTANDELVKLNDVQMFYWNVKLFNLMRVNSQYESSISAADNNIQLLATATQLKKQVESDIQAVRAELNRLEKNYAVGNIVHEEAALQPATKKIIYSRT